MQYPVESFTPAERSRLAPHFSDLDGPCFALVGLPETVKGAMFARYSRYPGTLRRLFLDEFADSLPAGTHDDLGREDEGDRAAGLYERIFLGYGDDSVAQLGGAHIACEWTSNVLTKILQRPRLAAYLEQSTRYIAYDQPIEGTSQYRYYRAKTLGPEYDAAMDELFGIYSRAIPRVLEWASYRFPVADGESPAAHARACNAKALDLLRGLLPAASLSHMGIYATGQTYEQLILHLLAHPLPEARRYGKKLLVAVQAVIPSFVTRVERPDRGGRWVEFLRERTAAGDRWARRLDLPEDELGDGPSVRLLGVHGTEEDLLAALLFEHTGRPEEETRDAVASLAADERVAMLNDLVGDRENRRHRPGRGFEAVRYRFEIVSDYGAFRDLQRHRMLTVQWQPLTPELGAGVPAELEEAGVADDYRRGLELSEAEWDRTRQPYPLCLGFRMRYILDLNAREAMQLVELRSGREGHPSYRAVAHRMHELIGEVHPAVAATFRHVDRDTEPRLERILSEMKGQARAAEKV